MSEVAASVTGTQCSLAPLAPFVAARRTCSGVACHTVWRAWDVVSFTLPPSSAVLARARLFTSARATSSWTVSPSRSRVRSISASS